MASRGLRRTGTVRRQPCLALPWAAESRCLVGFPKPTAHAAQCPLRRILRPPCLSAPMLHRPIRAVSEVALHNIEFPTVNEGLSTDSACRRMRRRTCPGGEGTAECGLELHQPLVNARHAFPLTDRVKASHLNLRPRVPQTSPNVPRLCLPVEHVAPHVFGVVRNRPVVHATGRNERIVRGDRAGVALWPSLCEVHTYIKSLIVFLILAGGFREGNLQSVYVVTVRRIRSICTQLP
jgi:hypothetical protein